MIEREIYGIQFIPMLESAGGVGAWVRLTVDSGSKATSCLKEFSLPSCDARRKNLPKVAIQIAQNIFGYEGATQTRARDISVVVCDDQMRQ